jgi:hypothetical protein
MNRSTDEHDLRDPSRSDRPDASRRQTYERVMAAAWPLITGPLIAHGVDRRSYVECEVDRRLRPVAEHMSYKVVPSDEQDMFLLALPNLVAQEWLLARCACRSCRAWDWADGPNIACPRLRRRLFVVVLERALGEAWIAQRPDDHALGMPRRLSRHPLAWRGGERKWKEHVRARGNREEGEL